MSTDGEETCRLDAGPKGRSRRVCDFKVGHTKIWLLLQKMSGETLGSLAVVHLLAHLVHETCVQLDVFVALLEHLGLPRGKDGGDVLEGRISFHRVLAWDTADI